MFKNEVLKMELWEDVIPYQAHVKNKALEYLLKKIILG